jgi:hypothetical protein
MFGWLVADGWCCFVLREKYCWLVAGGWFVVREKYRWLVADKSSEQGPCSARVLGFAPALFQPKKMKKKKSASVRGKPKGQKAKS